MSATYGTTTSDFKGPVSRSLNTHGTDFVRDAFSRLLDDHRRNDDPDALLELTGVSFLADDDHLFGAPNESYIKRELAWYQSQSLFVYDIPGGAPPIWKLVADDYGQVNSNYGYLLHGSENFDQYGNVLRELKRDHTSRRAIAIYTRPQMHDDATRRGGDDFVCTNTVQYLIRGMTLHAVVNMRSNDAVFGYRNDYAWQRHVLLQLARDLRVWPGDITWQAGSLHVYPRHLHLVEAYASSGVHDQVV